MRQRLKAMPLPVSKLVVSGGVLLSVLLILITAAVGHAATGNMNPEQGTTRFVVFFHNDKLSTNPTDCTVVFPVERTVPRTKAVAAAALNSLFSGPTAEEQGAGYRSFFSGATTGLLKGVRVKSDTAYVDLYDLRSTLSGATSSCGAAELQSQIVRTLRQFPSIQRVRFAIEGNPQTFHEWVNEACSRANDYCNPKPFRHRR